MKCIANQISGYTYGTEAVALSRVTVEDLNNLVATAGFTEEDRHFLHLAGEVLDGQTKKIVDHWRGGIIASIPNLSRHSKDPEGGALPDYAASSNLRFEQWILDTCLRPYDQNWINYQEEIALRHTSLKKNKTDGVDSTTYVPLRDIIGFVAVINETIKPYLGAKGHSEDVVRKMHSAWCKSLQLQVAIWTRPYADATQAPNEW